MRFELLRFKTLLNYYTMVILWAVLLSSTTRIFSESLVNTQNPFLFSGQEGGSTPQYDSDFDASNDHLSHEGHVRRVTPGDNGGDEFDEFGCCISCFEEWCALSQKCITVFEICTDRDSP